MAFRISAQNTLFTAAVSPVAPPFGWTGPTSGLINRWPLDLANAAGGTDVDVIGADNAAEVGTVTNGTGPSGRVNTARVFDGTTGCATPATSPLPSSGAFTVAIWANTTNIALNPSGVGQTFLNLGTNAGGNQIRLVENNGTVSATIGGLAWSALPGPVQQETSTAVFTSNQWLHIALTFDGASTYQTVINGAPIATITSGVGTPGTTDVIAARATNSGFFPGPLAQLVVYNAVLSAGDLTQLFNAR